MIKCGVPQGSVLGPLLSLLYVNDIFKSSEKLSFILFADDTNIFYQHKDMKVMTETLNYELKKVNLWLQANKLSLNIRKTSIIIFKTRRKRTGNIIVKINDTEIKHVESTKFLGIYIDSNLTWKVHINHIVNKVAKTTGILYKARHFFSSQALRTLYYSLIYPYLNYGNIIWGNTYPSRLESIRKLQRKIIRIISFSDFRDHTRPLFKNLSILPIEDLNNEAIALFPFIFLRNHFQQHLTIFSSQMITSIAIIQGPRQKFTKNRHAHIIKSILLKFKGCEIWNNLPVFIKNSKSFSIFKKKIKKYYLDLLH